MRTWKIPKDRKNLTKTALIDGDVLVYRIGFACQKDIYNVEYQGETYRFQGKSELNKFLYLEKLPPDSIDVLIDHVVEVEPQENAFHSIKLIIDDILDRVEAGRYEVYLTGDNNFREEVAQYKPYKGNRVGRHPELYDAIRDYFIRMHPTKIIDGMEADDMLSMRQIELGDSVICTIDKDLQMIPGEHYNWVTDKLIYISQEQGDRNFWKQMIAGDSVDNIIGIYGMADKKAEKALRGCLTFYDMFDVTWDLYQEKIVGDPVERFVENIHLLWMLRDEKEIPFRVREAGGEQDKEAVL